MHTPKTPTSDPGCESARGGGADFCHLPPGEREARREMIERDLLPRATRSWSLSDGRVWEFEPRDGLRERLEALVRFERGCCPGLRWQLTQRGEEGPLRLEIGGLPPDHPLGRERAQTIPASRGDVGSAAGAGSSFWTRLAGTVGLAGGVSLVVCCVLPVAAAALLGAAAAAPLATLDRPLVVLAAAGIAAVPVWRWLRRREARSRDTEPAERSDGTRAGCSC